MRYGKSAAQEINPALRRKPEQKLKTAAPGAPFGWCSDGTPYVGTQYCIKASERGLQFASLSTRNGRAQYYWKPLSDKVAVSALETYGSVEDLLANESSLPIGEVFEPSQLSAVKTVFRKLVGAKMLADFELAGEDDSAAAASTSAQATPAADGIAVKSDGRASGSAVVGKKRLARMAAADELRGVTEAAPKEKKAKKSAKAAEEAKPADAVVKRDVKSVKVDEEAEPSDAIVKREMDAAVKREVPALPPPAAPPDARSDSSGSPPPDDDDNE